MQQNVIATINQVAIILIEDKKLVPVKPICEALGVDFKSQFDKIKGDDILSSTVVLSTTVGGDEKQREMTCLPLEFVFGWLFTINHKNVKPAAQEAVKKYKLQCYHALYKHFTEYASFMQWRQKMIDARRNYMKATRLQFRTAKEKLQLAENDLDAAIQTTFDEWRSGVQQGALFTDAQTLPPAQDTGTE